MLKSNTTQVFFKYVIPSILGILAITSASIVDGYFIGNYVGSTGLAAINISYPIPTLLFGFALMFSVGSSVIVGKILGEKKFFEASNIFTKSMICVCILSFFICYTLYANIDVLFDILELEDQLRQYSYEYLSIILMFVPFLMIAIVLDYFVRVDENPNLSFISLVISAVINIVLDYIFVVELHMGLKGAALATGISQAAIIIILLPHFFLKRATLKLIKPTGSWFIMLKSLKNGSSEFINESSTGITIMIFNYIMLQNFGEHGVASYTIIGYFILVSVMISFAIADALQPIIAKNYGAHKYGRINSFLNHGFIAIIVIEAIITICLLITPDTFIDIFLDSTDMDTKNITVDFLYYSWPIFILAGINILVTSYLTAMQRPMLSALIAALRSLILPILLINFLPYIFEEKGLFMALTVSEVLTLIVAVCIFYKNMPASFKNVELNRI